MTLSKPLIKPAEPSSKVIEQDLMVIDVVEKSATIR
jgi:hypothetical protein